MKVAGKINNASLLHKLILIGFSLLPYTVPALFVKQNTNVHKFANDSANGTWIAQDENGSIVMKIKGDSALLSLEPGIKNIAYGLVIHGDSLTLSTDKDNMLSWHICEWQTNKLTVQDGVDELSFEKIK